MALDTGDYSMAPLGLLAALFGGQSADDAARQDAASRLARQMRQQSPMVPPPEDDQNFNARFGEFAPANGSSLPADVPLPRARPATADLASSPPVYDQATSQDMETIGPGPAPAAAAPAARPPGLLDRIGDALNSNSNLLLSLGAGFAGAPSIGTGIQRALTNAQPVVGMNQTVQALVRRGMPADLAQMAASNPAALQQILPRMLGAKQYQLGERSDMFGQKIPFLYDPVSGDTLDLNFGQRSGNAVGGATSGAQQTLGNFDLSKIDPNAKGWDYLKQWPAEVQSAAKAYMSGDVMPTGNPRNNNISSIAKTVAQKVAMDIGQPQLADDSLFSERRKMRTELGSSSQGSMGGILSNGKSAFEHLGTLSDKMTALGNTNGPNIPGGGHIASAENVLGNVVLPTSQTKDRLQQAADAALKYGQESTKFYSGTGGGEAERMFALKNLDFNSAPADQQAGFLQTEKELMTARLQQKEQQIRDTLGQDYLDAHPVMTPDLQATMNKIDANIGRLRGQAPAQQPQAATPMPQTPQDALAQARDAIAKGANRTQVILRLQKMGVNTSGL